jgi:hypothetical protein
MTHQDKSSNRGRIQQTVNTQDDPKPINIRGASAQVRKEWKAFCERHGIAAMGKRPRVKGVK